MVIIIEFRRKRVLHNVLRKNQEVLRYIILRRIKSEIIEHAITGRKEVKILRNGAVYDLRLELSKIVHEYLGGLGIINFPAGLLRANRYRVLLHFLPHHFFNFFFFT